MSDLLTLITDGFTSSMFGRFSAQLGQYNGAVSELVAATLQTKGMADQQKILDNFSSQLTDLAALIYLVSIMGAVGAMAVYGSYKKGMYLLIGPALFYFMIDRRIEANGTKLRVGRNEIANSPEEQRSFLNFIGQEANGGGFYRVSLAYGVYDSLVSAVVQDIVSVLLDTAGREHTRRVARERAFGWMLQQRGDNPGFVRLASAVLFGECAEMIQGYMNLGHKYKSVLARQGGTLSPEDTAQLQAYNAEKARIDAKWSGADNAGRPGQVALDQQLRIYLARYIGGQPNDYPTNASCKQSWDWMMAFAKLIAEKKLDKSDYLSARVNSDPNVDWDKVFADLRKALQGPNGNQDAVTILAAYILKNTLGSNTHWAMTQQIFSRVPFSQQKFNGIFSRLQAAESQGGFMKIMYFAGTVKYIQGMLLYLLSVGFPFFAVLLILPGRATSFFVWGSLWVWVKSWDIGFALVHVARDILWQFVVQGTNRERIDVDASLPHTVFSLIYSNDPLATENTYWQIVAILTCAVPFLTAHCCLGATNLYDAFKTSIDQTANRFGQSQTNAARRDHATAAEIRIQQKRAMIAMEATEASMKQPMRDSSGKEMQPGGYERQTRAFLEGQKAHAQSFWNANVQSDIGFLAAATGRRVTTGAGQSQDTIVRANVALRTNEAFRNRSAAGAINLPFVDQFSGHNDQTKAGVPFSNLGGLSGPVISAD